MEKNISNAIDTVLIWQIMADYGRLWELLGVGGRENQVLPNSMEI